MKLSAAEQQAIVSEVRDQFDALILAVNQMDAGAWSGYYSQEGFLSAISGTDYHGARNPFVEAIVSFFSTRERQHVDPVDVRVTALATDLALLTCVDRSEIGLKSGEALTFKHLFTMVWQKEPAGWKIVHSHESWIEEG